MFDAILQKIYNKKSKMFFDHLNVWTIIFQKLKKLSFYYARFDFYRPLKI